MWKSRWKVWINQLFFFRLKIEIWASWSEKLEKAAFFIQKKIQSVEFAVSYLGSREVSHQTARSMEFRELPQSASLLLLR